MKELASFRLQILSTVRRQGIAIEQSAEYTPEQNGAAEHCHAGTGLEVTIDLPARAYREQGLYEPYAANINVTSSFTNYRLRSLRKGPQVHCAFFTGTLRVPEPPNEPSPTLSTFPPPPKNWHEMPKHPYKKEFIEAAEVEWNKIVGRNTLKPVPMPKDEQVLPLCWVFTYKFDAKGGLKKDTGT
ncbi:uncharacterized protein ARB_06959 [Trichophyton benhamiae CBS 112371]|uniref:Uncharacterized protein n=1 Tax=Arthroderma benhamiae (strain ATCC MYA-4681 / CBS 112371) TaxID=663331 RepID=D4ARU5_ARTBC|nr:uncharacterized protein ARB_06959 [Trichophyton benhamiae CBS 112371]EFE34009.1 hypothetical protein ARB_06959 [Trichophyton benhamiae CBS 112371]